MPLILADKFIDGLIKAGLVHEGVTHVIIDAQVGYAVEIHESSIQLEEDKLAVVTAAVLAAKVQDGNSD